MSTRAGRRKQRDLQKEPQVTNVPISKPKSRSRTVQPKKQSVSIDTKITVKVARGGNGDARNIRDTIEEKDY